MNIVCQIRERLQKKAASVKTLQGRFMALSQLLFETGEVVGKTRAVNTTHTTLFMGVQGGTRVIIIAECTLEGQSLFLRLAPRPSWITKDWLNVTDLSNEQVETMLADHVADVLASGGKFEI